MGPHKGFVIKRSWQHGFKQLHHRPDIPPRVRPGVLAARFQAGVKSLQRCAGIGFCPGTLFKLYKGIDLFLASAKDTAWPMQFETATDNVDAVGQ